MGQTRGSNSAGQGSLAAPSLNPSFLSHWDSDKGISRQAWTPPPHPKAWRSCSAVLGGGGKEGARRGSFATQPEAPGPRLPALWASGCRPRAQRAMGPSALAGQRAEGGAGFGPGPAAGRSHLRVLLGKAVGRGTGGGKQR